MYSNIQMYNNMLNWAQYMATKSISNPTTNFMKVFPIFEQILL